MLHHCWCHLFQSANGIYSNPLTSNRKVLHESYRSKIVVVEECPEPIEEVVDIEPISHERMIEVETI